MGNVALPESVYEGMLNPNTWRLLKYYFSSESMESDANCPSCLWAPDRFRVILNDDQVYSESVDNLVREIYEGEISGAAGHAQ